MAIASRRRGAVEPKVLGAFDVAFNPEPGICPTMHGLGPGWIFSTEFLPRRIFFKVLQKRARIDRMKATMNVLAPTADDVWIKKLPQFMGELHDAANNQVNPEQSASRVKL